VLAIIQARMTSTRLPGKVLRPMAGRPMLAWLLDHLGQSRAITQVMVATSDQHSDQPIVDFCAKKGVPCRRGALHDVAGRLQDAAISTNADAFVRICGDSPLVDAALVDAIVNLYGSSDADVASNVQTRTYPKGLSVEAVRVAALRRARSLMLPGEEEHVTQVFYRCSGDFRIVNLSCPHDWSDVQLSVDTLADFAVIDRMLVDLQRSPRPQDVGDLVALRERCARELSL
jgi:spore coat polysaccharide biosynthesis protein SpsF